MAPAAVAGKALVARGLLAPEVFEASGFELNQLRQLGQQLLLERALGQPLPKRTGLAGQPSTPFGGLQVAVSTGRFDQET